MYIFGYQLVAIYQYYTCEYCKATLGNIGIYLPTGSVDYRELQTQKEKKKTSKNEDEADFRTFTSGRKQNFTFRCKNTEYKNRRFQLIIFLGILQHFLNTVT